MAKIFDTDGFVMASRYDLNTGIWIEDKEIQVHKGFSMERGFTPDICPKVKGKVGVYDELSESWSMREDDRGRVFYNKFNGEKYETVFLGESVDRKVFTTIAPPQLADGELTRFVVERQEWEIGFDWYEKPIWDKEQVKSFFTGDFFVPNSDRTNIEPPAPGMTLNDSGQWIDAPKQETPEDGAEA